MENTGQNNSGGFNVSGSSGPAPLPPYSSGPSNEGLWEIEGLIRRAFERTKERFSSYFVVTILGISISFLALMILLLGIVACAIIYSIAPVAGLILGVILALVVITVFIYISGWVQLSTLSVLVSPERLGAVETFKKTRAIVPGYVWFMLLSSTFIFGLLPFGFLTFFIILIAWSAWSTFSSFVYLERREKGLLNLWVSKALVSQRFWGILGRIFLINIAVLLVQGLLSGRNNAFSSLASFVFSILATPFTVSFAYEMYKNLRYPEGVKAPTAWVALSVVGWVLIFLAMVAFFTVIISALPSLGGGKLPLPRDLPFPTPPDFRRGGYL